MTPIVGNWYQIKNIDQKFEVVSCDEEDETVEIQYADGTVEHWTLEDWEYDVGAKNLTETSAPDDWAGGRPPRDDLPYGEEE